MDDQQQVLQDDEEDQNDLGMAGSKVDLVHGQDLTMVVIFVQSPKDL